MDWQNQQSKNGYTTKSNLHVQWNSHQNSNNIHYTDWKINPKVHLETLMTTNSQGNNEQKEQCWRYHNTQLQTILQSHINKNNMVLAPKQTWKPVKYSRAPGYESMQLHPLNFWQRCKNIQWLKKSFSTNVAAKLNICLQKTEITSTFVTLCKYQLKK
jgi:hypothetical protein